MKAFDSLDHGLLLDKLRKIGLAEKSMKWFISYLDRKQVVRHNGNVSYVCRFKNGIPQGSRLGLTLFIFYINDLFKYLRIDYCGFGPFSSTLTNLLVLISLF